MRFEIVRGVEQLSSDSGQNQNFDKEATWLMLPMM